MAERDLILDRDRFPSNTLADRQGKKEKPSVQKVIEGTAHKRKKPLGQQVAETFLMEDMENIGAFVVKDVVVPTLKNGIFQMIVGSLSMALFGTVKNVGQNKGLLGTVSYDKMYESPTRAQRAAKAQHRFEDLAFDDKFEADDILEAMRDLVEEYGQVSVADMYELAGESYDPIDRKWGWTNLKSASVIYSRGQYILDLPKTKPVEV